MPDSVRPHPWDSPGKNTAVGCHFCLQCIKVKSESEVTQSCPTLRNPLDCSPPGSSIHEIFQARVLEWGAIAFSVSVFLISANNLAFNFAIETENLELASNCPFLVSNQTLKYKYYIFSLLLLNCTTIPQFKPYFISFPYILPNWFQKCFVTKSSRSFYYSWKGPKWLMESSPNVLWYLRSLKSCPKGPF